MKRLTFILTVLFGVLYTGTVNVAKAQDNLNLGAKLQQTIDTNQVFIDGQYYQWCSSVIQGEDGKYHMFYARWPHGKRTLDDDPANGIFDGFSGWLKYSEIAYATADKPTGPFHYVKTILKGDGDQHKWNRYTMHNPQIRKFGQKYYLYYISNAFDSTFRAKNVDPNSDWGHWLKYNCTQKIGVLVANKVSDFASGNYREVKEPLIEPDGVQTFEVTTNPSVTQGPDGRYYMIFKSRKPNVGNMTMWMAVSDRPDKPFKLLSQVFTEPDMACEDPFLWYDKQRKQFYAIVKYYAHSGKLVSQFGALAMITSSDGLHWHAARHPLVSLRELKVAGQHKTVLAHLERPFILFDKKGRPQVLYAAASIGEPFKNKSDKVPKEENSFIVSFGLN